MRDEARNIAVIVVEEHGSTSGFKPAPISAISSRLHEQGLLDAALHGLERQVAESFTVERLQAMKAQLGTSLVLTDPAPVALVDDIQTATKALYKALVAPRLGGSKGRTKGVVLDQVVNGLRRTGFTVKRGAYVEDSFSTQCFRPQKAPPKPEASPDASEHFVKITRWLDKHHVPFATPTDIVEGKMSYKDLVAS
jgi:hypothetical protein